MMKRTESRLKAGLCIALLLLLSVSCRTASYTVVSVEGGQIVVDSTWDGKRTADETERLVARYRQQVDSLMEERLGISAQTMDRERPEDLLSNLVADILLEAATDVLGHPADIGLVNIGGLRSVLSAGPITLGTAYEILPFENSLCVLTIKGDAVRHLCESIARRRGEGVSGLRMTISPQGKLLQASVNGEPIENERLYTVGTIDYLAEGNDGMTALTEASDRACPEGATLRSLFVRYVRAQAAAGKAVTSRCEGRIAVEE